MRRQYWLLPLFLFVLGCSAEPDLRSLTILHTSDLHARFLPDSEGRGGFAHLATAIKQERAESDACLVLHAGDFVQGSPVSSIFEGLPVFEVANEMGFDVNTLGNHEFDYGWKRTLEFVQAAEFPTVSANVVNDKGELLTPEPYVIRQVNGIRLAVIGLLTSRLPEISKKEKVGPWQALPVVETARSYARELEDKVDLVVVLSHIFNDEDDEILALVPEVDLIVSGHNHGGQEDLKAIGDRLCVKVRAYGRELGRLDLRVDTANDRIAAHQWKRIPIEADAFTPDQQVADLVQKWEARVSKVVDVPIGVSRRRIAGKAELKPLIEYVMKEAVGADLAYMNRGGIRDGLPEGEVLARHIWNILPFGNTIRYGRVKGHDLPPEALGEGLIDPEREYVLATNSFMADRWAEQGLSLSSEGPLVREAMIEWVRRQKIVKQRVPMQFAAP